MDSGFLPDDYVHVSNPPRGWITDNLEKTSALKFEAIDLRKRLYFIEQEIANSKFRRDQNEKWRQRLLRYQRKTK